MVVDQKLRDQMNPAFRFIVDIGGETQGAFTECTLPTIEREIEEVKEGGLNTYVHQLPGRRKAARVTLKNGLGKSELLQWYFSTLKEQVICKPVSIILLDIKCQPILTWHLEDAFPIKWTGPQLKTDANTIAIHTVELVCGEVNVE